MACHMDEVSRVLRTQWLYASRRLGRLRPLPAPEAA